MKNKTEKKKRLASLLGESGCCTGALAVSGGTCDDDDARVSLGTF